MDPQTQTELRNRLIDRRDALRQRLDERPGAGSVVAHAHEVLRQDDDDAPQRDSDREVDQAVTDRERLELRQIDDALQRLAAGDYGDCADCGGTIPLARLRVEPQASQCVACESRRERSHGAARPPVL